MKNTKIHAHSFRTGSLMAVAAFIVLSVYAGGFIEISRDIGFVRYLRDTAIYLVMNKLAYKLVASVLIGVGAGFVSGMIAYGKQVKSKHNVRAAQLHLPPNHSGMERTA